MSQLNLTRSILTAVVGILIAAGTVFAQETPPKAQKFDEFTGEADYEDLMARLDNFLIELQQQPNAQGHIIVYRSRRDSAAVSNRIALRAKDYLVRVRRGDAARIQTFDGGMTGCLTYELWIVPPGAEPPPRRFTYKYPLKGSGR